MPIPRFPGIVRVTNSREEIERATQIGLDKKREGYSPEALVLAVDEVLQNLQLSRAIVVYVQNVDADGVAIEQPFSWFSVLVSTAFAVFCLGLVYVLFRQVEPATDFWLALLIVFTQALLIRFSFRGMRLAFMAAGDGLNDASYPTKLHPLRNASSSVGTIRLRRLRALVLETTERILAGESPKALTAELSEVNLTPAAARYVVRLASFSAAIRDFVPPYETRWLAYTLALTFLMTCVVSIERAGDRLAEGYQNYAGGLAAWVASWIASKPRRHPRSPAS